MLIPGGRGSALRATVAIEFVFGACRPVERIAKGVMVRFGGRRRL